jgi:hypothetical protein
MISNLNSYSALANTATTSTTTNTSEVDSIIAKHKESSAEKVAEANSNQSNLYLSNRAQKINAISTEFFSGSDLSLASVEDLKERVYQLGLISKDEYAKLTNSAAETTNVDSANENSTISLTSFLGNLLERLKSDDDEKKKSDDDNSTSTAEKSEALTILIKTLEAAKEIISNVDEAKREADFQTTLKDTLSLLKETIEAPTFEKIPLDDKVGLSKVYQTLEIVDKLSPQRLSNEKVNKYLELSFR